VTVLFSYGRREIK